VAKSAGRDMPMPGPGDRARKAERSFLGDLAIDARGPFVLGSGNSGFDPVGHFISRQRHNGRVETMLHPSGVTVP